MFHDHWEHAIACVTWTELDGRVPDVEPRPARRNNQTELRHGTKRTDLDSRYRRLLSVCIIIFTVPSCFRNLSYRTLNMQNETGLDVHGLVQGCSVSVVVRALDLWSRDPRFDSRPVHCNSAFHPSGVGKSSTSLPAGIKAGRVYVCRVAGKTVWSHMACDVP